MNFLRSLLDLVFPPLCIHCKALTTLSYLCQTCWQESILLDPHGRCHHCFEEIGEPFGLCDRCRHKPLLPFPRAALFAKEAPICSLLELEEATIPIASFCVYQHARLDWKEPDLIAPIPPNKRDVARNFGELIQTPCPNLFRVIGSPYGIEWRSKEHLLDEEKTLLLLDVGCSFAELQMASRAISETFVQHVYILSINY